MWRAVLHSDECSVWIERNKAEKEMYAIRQQHRAPRRQLSFETFFSNFLFCLALVFSGAFFSLHSRASSQERGDFAFWGSFQILSNKSRLNESFRLLVCDAISSSLIEVLSWLLLALNTKMSNIFFLDLSSSTNSTPLDGWPYCDADFLRSSPRT